MSAIDNNLSTIDENMEFSFFKSGSGTSHAQILGIFEENEFFEFSLETFHLAEKARDVRGTVTEHSHKVYHAVFYLKNGSCQIEGKRIRTSRGDLILIPPDMSHSFAPLQNENALYNEITFSLECKEGKSSLNWEKLLSYYSGQETASFRNPLSGKNEHEFRNAYRKIADLLKSGISESLEIKAAILELFMLIQKRISGDEQIIRKDRRLLEAKQRIEESFTEEFKLEKLAKRCGISREQFCRAFKGEFGEAPLEYRNRLRHGAAERMLRYSAMPIKEIASRLGYSEIYSFSKAFKKYSGESPAAFRKK